MLCNMCGDKKACVHLTQIVNNNVKKIQLCESCAIASGLDVNNPESFPEILLGIGGFGVSEEKTSNKTCPVCQMHFSDFKKTLRLGCKNCYNAFQAELEPLIDGMQKGKKHVGKTPAHHVNKESESQELLELKKTLRASVAAENYEEAALLRDQINRYAKKNSQKVSVKKLK